MSLSDDKNRLVIDVGNTLTKIALFHNNEILNLLVLKSADTTGIIKTLYQLPPYSPCIVSAVRPIPCEISDILSNRFNTLFFSSSTPIPLKNLYKTPETLGYDRLAASVGAWQANKGSNILVIDAGTAITYDFTDKKGQYHGGAISPGIDMRFKALHAFTGRLPLTKKSGIRYLTGDTTLKSLKAGVIHGTALEVDGMINLYRKKYNVLKAVITGGDAKFLVKRLKNSIFALPNLVLSGLNLILSYNIENKSDV